MVGWGGGSFFQLLLHGRFCKNNLGALNSQLDVANFAYSVGSIKGMGGGGPYDATGKC
jgi:hypothetical protein